MADALRERKLILLLIAAESLLLAWVPLKLPLRIPLPRELFDVMEAQVFVVAAFLAIRKHWKLAVALLLLSPVNLRFWESAYRYARGEAYYVVPFAKSSTYVNQLDDRKIPIIDVGPSSSSLAWWRLATPHNAAVDLCFAAFGAMPGAYDGPLPTWEDIKTSVDESPLDVEFATVQRGSIQVGDTLVQLRPDVGARMVKVETEMLKIALGRAPDATCLSTLKARVALWQERVLMVAMPWESNCNLPIEERMPWFSFAAAIDARSGRVLGYYELESRLGNESDGLAGIWLLDNYGSPN